MFANTITLTVNAVAKVLTRVNQDNYGSEYRLRSGTESISMKIRHTQDTPDSDGLIMDRHNVFVEYIVYGTPTTAMKKRTYTATIRSSKQEDPIDSAYLASAVEAWMTASVNASLVAGEN